MWKKLTTIKFLTVEDARRAAEIQRAIRRREAKDAWNQIYVFMGRY